MNTTYSRWGKRAFDVAASALSLVVLSPVLAVVALLVRARLGRPVLFRQQRPGLHGEPFTVLKFRTMSTAMDQSGRLLPDEARLTRFGRTLRNLSLDELPEFWNVLRGDMSLVGPRPLLMQYLPRYSREQARRHDVRPGITGLAQVEGRNALSWDEKFKLDIFYVDNLSLAMDLAILLRTQRAVLAQNGISAAGVATMTEFRGPGAGSDSGASTEGRRLAEQRGDD